MVGTKMRATVPPDWAPMYSPTATSSGWRTNCASRQMLSAPTVKRTPVGTPDTVQVLTIQDDNSVGNYRLSGVVRHDLGHDHAMLDRGVWLPPSSYEAMFLSAAHTPEHINAIVSAARESFREVA